MAAQDVQGMLVRIEATTAQLRAEMKRADAAVGNATKGIDKQLSKVDGAFDRLGVGAGKAASAVRALAPALAGLATLEALRRAQQLGEEFTLLEARIKRLSGGTAEAAVTYSRLAEVARQSGTSLGDTVKLWESLTGTLEELGATDAQVVRLTDTLQKIGTIGGSSAQEVSSALRQLGQGLAGGVIRAEEFNSVIEGMPELGREIARGLGVPFGELRQLMLDGELTAEKVLGAIQRHAFDVDAEFAKLPRTVSQASNALTNDFGRAISEIDKAIGGSVNLARFLDTLAKGIRFTAGDFTDLERLNQLTAERAKLQQSYEQAERRTLLSAKERATFENGLKRLNTEILEIQNRRVQQMKEEGKAIQRNGPAQNEQYDKYLAKLKESAALQGVNSEVAKVRYAIEKGELGKLTEAQQASLLKYAEEKDAKIAAEKAGLSYVKGLEDQASAIKALADKYDPAAKAQAAYDAGIKLADEALKNNTYTTEQYQKVVQGLYTDLNKPIWDKHNKQADEAAAAIKKIDDQLESVRDRIDPVRAATKRLTAEKKLFKDQLDAGSISLEEYTQNVALLEKEYDDNIRATSEWAQWTEGALDRVDSAFADAWRNIGDGFSSFRDSLTDAFKQMLAELAHMAITKPIIMQLGASMGIGNGTQGNNGIWGSLLGGSSGSSGGGIGGALQVANQGRSLLSSYGTIQSMWPALQGGWGSGGFGGMLSAGGSYLGSMFGVGSGAAGSLAAGSTAAGYTGAGMQAWVAAQSANTAATSGLSSAISGMSGMLTNPVTWIVAGMMASNKLWDDGVRISGKDTSRINTGSRGAVGDVAWAPFTAGSYAVELMDKSLSFVADPLNLFGEKMDKLVAIFTGSPVTQAVTDFLGKGLFGGQWETKNYGLTAEVANGGFGSFSYQYQKKDGGWFGSDKKRTTYTPIEQETNQALNDTYDAVESGVVSLFERLNLSVSDAALAGINIARTDISTKGKTEEEIQQAVSDWFTAAGESINTQLNAALGTGLDYDLAGMQAFIGNLEGVNEVIRYLDVSMYDMSVAGGKLAEALSAASGGLDALATNSQTYYAAFFSEAEKVEDTVDSIKRAFESADVELVGSREAYRAMVEDIDLTTAAGQEMFSLMMALSGQAAQYFSIVEQQAAQATAALMGAVSSDYASLQRSIANQQREIQQAASSTVSNINALTGVSNSLDAALKKLRGTSDDTVRMLRAQATMTLNSALVTARAGGSLAGFAGLQDALDVASQMDTALYGSLTEFEREQGRTANLIAELEKVNGKQLSVEQQVLKSLESQLSALDQQLAFAQAQLDALNGVDNSVLSIVDAVNAMNASVVAALSLMGGDAGKNATPQNSATLIGSVYQAVLGRDADAGGAAYWQSELASGAIRLDQLEQAIKNAAIENGQIPAFASGGFHSGGMRLVGEQGPELEVTGPSRIYNASQTAAMLGGGDSAAAITSLQRTVEGQSAALRSIAKHTMQTAKRVEFLERWDFDGLPKERGAA